MLKDNGLDAELSYFKMDPRKTGQFNQEIFEVFVKVNKNRGKYLDDRSIMGAFNYLDIDKTMKVDKKNYQTLLEKAF